MGSFSEGSGAVDTLAAPSLNVAGTVASTNGGAGLVVGGMVDVMKQFDSNGNQMRASVETAISSSQSLAKPNPQSGAAQGYLVVTES
jgi:seryl-tRNA(Sec) selenium transferase